MLTNVIYPEDLSHGLINEAKSINGLIPIYKNIGETPLECLNRLRGFSPMLKNATLSYAGRLDPLAEGLLLVLVGDFNKEREKYLSLDKTYEVDILFGISTDTGDVLGLIKNKDLDFFLNNSLSDRDEQKIKKFEEKAEEKIKDFVGKINFPYPAYSSKTVDGKPLFQYAREGSIDDIEVPTKEADIYSIKLMNFIEINFKDLLSNVEKKIDSVKGDFRQEEILNEWKKLLGQMNQKDQAGKNTIFLIMKIKCECSSGAYMRTLSEEIGKSLSVPALAFGIKRTAIDNLNLKELGERIF